MLQSRQSSLNWGISFVIYPLKPSCVRETVSFGEKRETQIKTMLSFAILPIVKLGGRQNYWLLCTRFQTRAVRTSRQMSFSEKNTHTLTNTDTMSPFLIFFIVVTIGYVLYYAAIITMDMNAKPKDAVTQGETMEAPDGIETTEDYNGEDIDEETASREADEENNDDYPEGHSEDETDDDQQGEYNNQGAYMNVDESPTEPESQTSDTEPEDDDIYGIDNQMNEESEKQETEPSPSSEEAFPSN